MALICLATVFIGIKSLICNKCPILLLLQSTEEYNSKDQIMRALEKHGGICDCQSSRYVSTYSSYRNTLKIQWRILQLNKQPGLLDFILNIF